jgi:hypothetical protein
MTKAQAKLLEPGDMYRLGMYVATSTKKSALAVGHASGLREWQEAEMGTAVRSNPLAVSRHSVGENVHSYPMSLPSLMRRASELVNSDTCVPRH